MRCDLCGREGVVFANHFEKHIYPPRYVQICRSCHSSIHSHLMHKTRHELVWQIPVDAELDRRAKSILETGIYISLSELVRDAVRRYLEQRLKREEEHGGA